jgi:tetratricopeptide (TPR) repeat protein
VKIVTVTLHPPGDCPAWITMPTVADGYVCFESLAHPVVDFSAERNHMLDEAKENGDWALIVDTDEHFTVENPDEVRAALSTTPHDVLRIEGEGYWKEKFFRLPARGRFVGPVHEYFQVDEGSTIGNLSGITFTEDPKTEEQIKAKRERDIEALMLYIHNKNHRDEGRWWYYLGDACEGIDDFDGAVHAFQKCSLVSTWDEDKAWCFYRIAAILARFGSADAGKYNDAIKNCFAGMEIRPDFPEFPWLIGWCEYQRGNDQHAIVWADIARNVRGAEWNPPRIGFRYELAHTTGPNDVHRYARRRLDGLHH